MLISKVQIAKGKVVRVVIRCYNGSSWRKISKIFRAYQSYEKGEVKCFASKENNYSASVRRGGRGVPNLRKSEIDLFSWRKTET